MSVLGELNVDRVMITDGEGRALYDSFVQRPVEGDYVLVREVADALAGQDVFYSRYTDGMLISHAALPIMSYDIKWNLNFICVPMRI